MKKLVYTSFFLVTFVCSAIAQDSTAVTQPQPAQQTTQTITQPAPKKTVTRKTPAQSSLAGTNLPLSGQFDLVINKSESYQSYKVVKKTSLNKLKINSMDSIAALKQNIISLEDGNEDHLKEINKLKEQLVETQASLDKVTNEKDSFSFLGFLMLKGAYNTMMWLIVLVLAIIIAVLVIMYKRSHFVTSKTQESLNDKQEELDKHRKWALDREQTLARELNKLKQKYKGFE